MRPRIPSAFKIGDAIERALATVGITPERVETYLGRPCRCRERKRKLNEVGNWAYRILSGNTDKAKEEFDKIVGEEEKPPL